MSTVSPRNRIRWLALISLAGLTLGACSPSPRPVATQRPQATTAPTVVAASPTARVTTQPAVGPTTAPATTAPTLAPTVAAPTAKATQPPAEVTEAVLPTPSTTELTQPVPLGGMLSDGDLQIVALKVEQQVPAGAPTPRPNYHFELVTVKVTNSSSQSTEMFVPEDFVLFDSASEMDIVMDLPVAFSGLPDALQVTQLEPGQAVTGVIAFEVPDSAANWTLKYQSNTARLLWSLSG